MRIRLSRASRLRVRAALGALAAMGLTLAACAPKTYRYRKLVMGTEATVAVVSEDETRAREAGAAAFARMDAIDASMSDWRADSEVCCLCRTADTEVPVSADLFEVLVRAEELRVATDGAFDVSVGPLTELWRASRAGGSLPSPEALAAARARCGGERIELDRTRQSVRLGAANMRIDLGGIAKGYAAQAAVATLRELGVPRCLVAISGDIAAGDAPPGKRAWTVEVEFPGGSRESIDLLNASVSTSGDREQFVEVDGVRYGHIVDPRTGLGATATTQVTVIGPDGAVVDGLASALAIRGASPEVRAAFPGYRVIVGEPAAKRAADTTKEFGRARPGGTFVEPCDTPPRSLPP